MIPCHRPDGQVIAGDYDVADYLGRFAAPLLRDAVVAHGGGDLFVTH
jgi:hypothetical protein